MAVSGFFDPRAAMRAMRGIPPRFQFGGRDGGYSFVVGERDHTSGRYIARHTPLAFGVKAIVDLGTAERGWLRFNPFDDSNLVPMHRPVSPEPPDDGFTLVVRLPMHVESYGMAVWTIGGTIAQNAAFEAFLFYQKSVEAAAGKIPVWQFGPSEQVPIRSRNAELHFVPSITTVGWVVRDPAKWRARSVPLPVAQVEDDSHGATPLIPPMVAPVTPSPVNPLPPANDAAPVPAPASANDDMFADMMPVEGPAF
jgi:hypothetical protein